MELRNKTGEVTKIADDMTIKEIVDMGFSVDICDEHFDANEHWVADSPVAKGSQGEYP